ncbi:hypothetical protein [Nostoc sp.]|uniref:hypothetical protein n=1 Tax=Nostoc sp. TaxID=1180 RepID=UPI002FF8F3A2
MIRVFNEYFYKRSHFGNKHSSFTQKMRSLVIKGTGNWGLGFHCQVVATNCIYDIPKVDVIVSNMCYLLNTAKCRIEN